MCSQYIICGLLWWKTSFPQEEYVVTENETVNSTEESNDVETEDVAIQKHNELEEVSEETIYTPITFSDEVYLKITNLLAGSPTRFVGEEYFCMDQALEKYRNTTLDDKTNYELLNKNGKIDVDKLYEKVLEIIRQL